MSTYQYVYEGNGPPNHWAAVWIAVASRWAAFKAVFGHRTVPGARGASTTCRSGYPAVDGSRRFGFSISRSNAAGPLICVVAVTAQILSRINNFERSRIGVRQQIIQVDYLTPVFPPVSPYNLKGVRV